MIFRSGSIGQVALGALIISGISGIVVAYQYEAAIPFVSSVAIEAVLPFGAFWRALHFWSSQAFVILLGLHVWRRIGDLPRISQSPGKRRHWAVVGTTIPFAIFALFSGYVLRHDATGMAAGSIAEHLMLDVPFIGNGLDCLLISTGSEGVNRIYVVHFLMTVLCWMLGTWYHTKKVILRGGLFLLVLATSLLFSYIVHAPMDLPGQAVHLIKGPWFFLGVQELLRHLTPLVAGVLFPSIPVFLLISLPWFRPARRPLLLLGLWFMVYIPLTLVGWLR